MELTVLERVLLLNLDTLPKQGNLITLRVLDKLMKAVGFTEEEIKKWNLRIEGQQVLWDNGESVEIPITPKQKELVRKALQDSVALTPPYLLLAEKFEVEVKDE